MTYLTMGQAEQIVPVARSTFRKHAKQGKFSTSKNARGLQIVQITELERYYDKLKPFPEDIESINTNGHPDTTDTDQNGQVETPDTFEKYRNGQAETSAETQEIIELLKSQLADTKSELADAKLRETKLLSMLSTEQEKTKLLMLTPPADQPKKKNRSFFGYFRFKR